MKRILYHKLARRKADMKFKLIIDKEHGEEVIVYAHGKSKTTEELERICSDSEIDIIGYSERETRRLEISEINCFIVEDNKVFALTQNERYTVKLRLYQLEEQLSDGFIKINQSCIASIKNINSFQASFSGSLTVKFKNGYSDYVSRRNLKNVKERLGI